MDEFASLRKLAREKRDRLIATARADYAATFDRIAALERTLRPKWRRPRESIGASVDPLMPQDRPFTIPELMTKLEALNGPLAWPKKSLAVHIYRLQQHGIIRRIRRSSTHRPALFAVAGLEVAPQPFDGMTLAHVCQRLLVRPMNVTELTVAILEAGYRTSQSKRVFGHSVAAVLRAKGNWFRREGGKWAAR
jgi:hypothetical protein